MSPVKNKKSLFIPVSGKPQKIAIAPFIVVRRFPHSFLAASIENYRYGLGKFQLLFGW
jgi:hypothetical protein